MATTSGIIGLDSLNGAPYGAYAVNLDQIIRYWNRSAERITGHRACAKSESGGGNEF